MEEDTCVRAFYTRDDENNSYAPSEMCSALGRPSINVHILIIEYDYVHHMSALSNVFMFRTQNTIFIYAV